MHQKLVDDEYHGRHEPLAFRETLVLLIEDFYYSDNLTAICVVLLHGVQLSQTLDEKENELLLVLLCVVVDDVFQHVHIQVHAVIALPREQPPYQIAQQLVCDLVVVVVVYFYVLRMRGL